MSDLEDIIKENRERFEDASPPAGHETRFLRRLDRAVEKDHNGRLVFWRFAAVGIAMVAIAVSLLIPQFNSPEDVQYGSMSLGDVSNELADVELYYRSKLSEEYKRIETLSVTDPLVKSYLEELEALNQEYKELETLLYESGSHEKVVLAMIANFRLRLELIEKLESEKNKQTKDTIQ